MIRRTAIPIDAFDGTQPLVRGSAFLMEHGGQFGLVTAAHLGLGEVNPRSNWAHWPTHFRAHLDPTRNVTFDLFHTSFGPPAPRFQFLPFTDGTDSIADVLLLTGSRHARQIDALKESYRVFSGVHPDLTTADVLHAHGYPIREDDVWPDVTPETTDLPFLADEGDGMIRVSGSVEEGYSGGPVVGPGEFLVGMVFGHDDGVGAVAATSVMAELFRRATSTSKR